MFSSCMTTEVLNVDNINIDELKESSLQVDGFSYLVLQSSSGNYINRISDIKYRNGRYYLFDSDQGLIMIYNESGKELGSIKAIGHGLGEYIQPLSFDVDTDGNVYVADVAKKAILEYSCEDYRFKKSIDVGVAFWGLGVINENEFWLTYYLRKNYFDGKLGYFDARLHTITPICKSLDKRESSITFGSCNYGLYRSDSLLYFYERFTPYVYRLNERGLCSDTVMFSSSKLADKKDVKTWVKNPLLLEETKNIVDLNSFFIVQNNIYAVFNASSNTKVWCRENDSAVRFAKMNDSAYYYLNNYIYTTDGEYLVSWCNMDRIRNLDDNQRTPLVKEILSETDSIGDKVNMVLLKYRFK